MMTWEHHRRRKKKDSVKRKDHKAMKVIEYYGISTRNSRPSPFDCILPSKACKHDLRTQHQRDVEYFCWRGEGVRKMEDYDASYVCFIGCVPAERACTCCRDFGGYVDFNPSQGCVFYFNPEGYLNFYSTQGCRFSVGECRHSYHDYTVATTRLNGININGIGNGNWLKITLQRCCNGTGCERDERGLPTWFNPCGSSESGFLGNPMFVHI